jgi:pyruvate/2-oxoglutarate dehydrogenase complex dihydrolipoamide dehydrogenase (E3) component
VNAILRTLTTGEGKGFMKALVAQSDDRILGFTMIGAEADGLLAAMQMAMLAKVPYPAVRDAIFAHPTMAEGLGLLFSSLPQEHAR